MNRTPTPHAFYRQRGKRWLDIVVSGCGLLLLAPILAVIALIVRAGVGSPVLFRQPRPGRDAAPFVLVKFRTMTESRDATGHALADGERLTRCGRLLRAASLDELPELVNVWRGEMSLVGPRPLLMQYRERYTPHQARRHAVSPGITGWAQVNGRNALSWDDKFRLDLWYVDHCSLALDLKILAMTCATIVSRTGITEPGHASAGEFMGWPRS